MIKTAIIIDDEEAGIANMERLLSYCDDIKVVAKSKSPEKAVELITEKKPDILFLDVEMPRMSGVRGTLNHKKSRVKSYCNIYNRL